MSMAGPRESSVHERGCRRQHLHVLRRGADVAGEGAIRDQLQLLEGLVKLVVDDDVVVQALLLHTAQVKTIKAHGWRYRRLVGPFVIIRLST